MRILAPKSSNKAAALLKPLTNIKPCKCGRVSREKEEEVEEWNKGNCTVGNNCSRRIFSLIKVVVVLVVEGVVVQVEVIVVLGWVTTFVREHESWRETEDAVRFTYKGSKTKEDVEEDGEGKSDICFR